MGVTTTPVLLIDDRAGSKELVKYAPLDQRGVLCHLEFGDVAIAGKGPGGKAVKVGVEMKSLADMVASLQSRRLQQVQVPGMEREYDERWLLTYGEYREDEEGMVEVLVDHLVPARKVIDRGTSLVIEYPKSIWQRFPFYGPKDPKQRPTPVSYFESFIVELTAMGWHHKHCRSVQECARWLGRLAGWWSKPWGAHKALKVMGGRYGEVRRPGLMSEAGWKESGMELKADVAVQFAGVGQDRARAAARHFRSARDMAVAGVDEWVKVDGVGAVTAGRVVEQWTKGEQGREE